MTADSIIRLAGCNERGNDVIAKRADDQSYVSSRFGCAS
jgi:hypothetical protein